jgi:hypothetical protein
MSQNTHDDDDAIEVTPDDVIRALTLQQQYRAPAIEGYAKLYNQATGLLAVMDQYDDAADVGRRGTGTYDVRPAVRALADAMIAEVEAHHPVAVRDTLDAAGYSLDGGA